MADTDESVFFGAHHGPDWNWFGDRLRGSQVLLQAKELSGGAAKQIVNGLL